MPDAARPGRLDIEVERGAEQILIRMRGEVDLSNAASVQEAIDSAREEEPDRSIVVDLAGLEFIDSTGLSVLVGATRRSRENGNRLQVRGATGQVRRVLEVAGVHDWLLTDAETSGD